MWLINCQTFALEFFHDPCKVKYAILSHTWGDGEVTFKDMADLKKAQSLKGFDKIRGTCATAIADGFQYAWVDTCCIDKSSSAELSEAINSMFSWYRLSQVCYVYLSDVSCKPINIEDEVGRLFTREDFCKSRWFTRGWTLQELIAPTDVRLYDTKWNILAILQDDKQAVNAIVRRTGIPEAILVWGHRLCFTCRGDKIKGMCGSCRRSRESLALLENYTVAERMSWAATRDTTRPEDRAYSLLGIFGVNMPLLYGEGHRSFARLQEEIIKLSDDQSILAHRSGGKLFADSPDSFYNPMEPGFGINSPFVKLNESTCWLSSERNAVEMRSNGKSVEMSMLLCRLQNDDARLDSHLLHVGILACTFKGDGLSRPAVLLKQSSTNPETFCRHGVGHLLKITALSPRKSVKDSITSEGQGTLI
ncbi:heterokaryon incompatibility protein-domain-containing protein [Immersiella caudata]|uniref:Heterokaryon incompatibility protein-domain-containing protein n=1 Tax=Immersiella caudata TaxID=314043 RepID=A0AA39X502_9PEZI|nr:heterokaryon incompatibility protein-domain-containing protein [Immersiella caudata]